MNGWIETGNDISFKHVKTTDVVIRTEQQDDAVVVCNGGSGDTAAMYVSQNNVGFGMRPRQFAAIDVAGSIFCDTKLELCSNSAQHPITYPRYVAEPNRMYFSDKPNNTPVVVDGVTGFVLADDVVVRKTIGVLSKPFSIPLKRVATSDVASDIDISDVTFKKYFTLDAFICIEQIVTQIVQFSVLEQGAYRVTLAPPIPSNIMSDSVVRAVLVDRPAMQEVDEYNNKSFTRIEINTLTKIDNYNWRIKCTGIINDMISLANEYIAISKTPIHNYQHIVQIRYVKFQDGFTFLHIASPSLKNTLDLTGFETLMYIYHIDAPKDFLWQKEFNLNISFVVDSNKIGYYLRIENTNLVDMMSDNGSMENINSIDKIIISEPEMYAFNITKTYVQNGKALLYIDEQSAGIEIPTMFSGYYDIQYKLTGMPIIFNTITRQDECTVFIQCTGVQGYSFGDAMTIICSNVHNYKYLLLNDTSNNAWRILKAELGKGLTIRCSDAQIVSQMIDEAIPRVVYAIPFNGKQKPPSWHDNIVLNQGTLVFRDTEFKHPDTDIKYKNNKLNVGPSLNVSKSIVVADAPIIARDFIHVNDERLHANTLDITDTSKDLEFINHLSLVEFDGGKRGVRSSGVNVPFYTDGILSDGRSADDVKTLSVSDALFRCIGAIQELSKKFV